MLVPSSDLQAMIEAAQAAGAGLQRHFGQLAELAIRSKSGPADLVSIADEEAERTCRALLAKAQPAYGFLGEEGGAFGGSDDAQTWIVDPLDGTTNFLFACPLWGVNIALAREGEVVAGVTYLPAVDEMYVAEQGKGAWLNGQRIRVSQRGALIDAVLACGIPFAGKPDHPLFAREMALLSAQVAGIRRTGACAVDMAWVAAGRWDAYWERALNVWDMAPGVILVKEAGGVATSATGSVLDLHGQNVCVSNGAVHAALIETLNAALENPAA
ncbi:inositol monophosphatase family protein [Pseudoxanthomonas wuyuanensis]|uniref:Inositol-1-monophosphatase n=1 Tax=Pseudoxanthomonas wuyuanensis TaxID=1073196 RepID=A0A286D6M2_9GAMM|nr:inositol monophosphatase family protein [Pseudoxanthomonas wuyuanensis]SOD54302.1 myo-inositol-1(or 4)-monophosphatase [Pseudoxanthomonas wuyuanensis]